MKNILLLLLFSFAKLSAQQISDVQIKNSWIIVYNEKAKEISRMPQAKYEVVGTAGSFFVVKNSD